MYKRQVCVCVWCSMLLSVSKAILFYPMPDTNIRALAALWIIHIHTISRFFLTLANILFFHNILDLVVMYMMGILFHPLLALLLRTRASTCVCVGLGCALFPFPFHGTRPSSIIYKDPCVQMSESVVFLSLHSAFRVLLPGRQSVTHNIILFAYSC